MDPVSQKSHEMARAPMWSSCPVHRVQTTSRAVIDCTQSQVRRRAALQGLYALG